MSSRYKLISLRLNSLLQRYFLSFLNDFIFWLIIVLQILSIQRHYSLGGLQLILSITAIIEKTQFIGTSFLITMSYLFSFSLPLAFPVQLFSITDTFHALDILFVIIFFFLLNFRDSLRSVSARIVKQQPKEKLLKFGYFFFPNK